MHAAQGWARTRWSKHLPRHSTVAAYAALVLAVGGTAAAATGGTFLLGRSNSAGATSTLSNTGSGVALSLNTKAGSFAPLSVNSSHLVTRLNSNYLQGMTASQFGAVDSANITVGSVSCTGICAEATYGSVSGVSPGSFMPGATDTLTPSVALVARDLSVKVTTAPGALSIIVGLIVNDADTEAISCTFTGSATTCTNPTGTGAVPPSSTISLLVTELGQGPSNTQAEDVLVGFRLAPA